MKVRIPTSGNIEMTCPECETKCDITWWAGEKASYWYPGSPFEWEVKEGCDHLNERRWVDHVKERVNEDIQDYIAGMVDRYVDEMKEQKWLRREKMDE